MPSPVSSSKVGARDIGSDCWPAVLTTTLRSSALRSLTGFPFASLMTTWTAFSWPTYVGSWTHPIATVYGPTCFTMCAATGVATLARPIANSAIAQLRAERCTGCIPHCGSMGGRCVTALRAERIVDPLRSRTLAGVPRSDGRKAREQRGRATREAASDNRAGTPSGNKRRSLRASVRGSVPSQAIRAHACEQDVTTPAVQAGDQGDRRGDRHEDEDRARVADT